jgi:hypothetical protein
MVSPTIEDLVRALHAIRGAADRLREEGWSAAAAEHLNATVGKNLPLLRYPFALGAVLFSYRRRLVDDCNTWMGGYHCAELHPDRVEFRTCGLDTALAISSRAGALLDHLEPNRPGARSRAT